MVSDAVWLGNDGEQGLERSAQDYAPLILENGLDPGCGHLTKGTWLGGIAEKAHSYAAKGPGPEANQDGDRLRLGPIGVDSLHLMVENN